MPADHLSPDRVGKLGSSHIAALFGCSPYLTRLQLHAHFRSGYDIDRGNGDERMKWGRRLQDDILEEVAEQLKAEVVPNPDHWLAHPEPDLKCGATVDGWIRGLDVGLGLAECKCVASDVYWKDWTDETAPQHVELQVQQQLWVSGASWAVIAALVGGNEFHLLRREPIPSVHAAIEREVRKFWREVEDGTPPDPLGRTDEIGALAALPQPIPDAVLDLGDDPALAKLVDDYLWAQDRRRQILTLYDECRVKLIAALRGHAIGRSATAFFKLTRTETEAIEVKRRAGTRLTLTVKPREEKR